MPTATLVMPYETHAAARKVYSEQHIYVRIGDQLEHLLSGIHLNLLDPLPGISADMLFRLALVSAFQYLERLPDPAAAEATLRRMDWKYALCLPAHHPGIAAPVLCAFRKKLLIFPQGMREFESLLVRLAELGFGGEDLPDGHEVLSTVCHISRLHRVKQAMKSALSVLATFDPDFLRAHALPHWYERYKTGPLTTAVWKSREAMREEAEQTGKDILHILMAVQKQGLGERFDLAEIWEIDQLWKKEFISSGDQVEWKSIANATCNCA